MCEGHPLIRGQRTQKPHRGRVIAVLIGRHALSELGLARYRGADTSGRGHQFDPQPQAQIGKVRKGSPQTPIATWQGLPSLNVLNNSDGQKPSKSKDHYQQAELQLQAWRQSRRCPQCVSFLSRVAAFCCEHGKSPHWRGREVSPALDGLSKKRGEELG